MYRMLNRRDPNPSKPAATNEHPKNGFWSLYLDMSDTYVKSHAFAAHLTRLSRVGAPPPVLFSRSFLISVRGCSPAAPWEAFESVDADSALEAKRFPSLSSSSLRGA